MDNLTLFIEFVEQVKVYIANLKQQLADALSNDVADDATIEAAQAEATKAKEDLAIWQANEAKTSEDLATAIQSAKDEILLV